jgi:hypothetical protein
MDTSVVMYYQSHREKRGVVVKYFRTGIGGSVGAAGSTSNGATSGYPGEAGSEGNLDICTLQEWNQNSCPLK